LTILMSLIAAAIVCTDLARGGSSPPGDVGVYPGHPPAFTLPLGGSQQALPNSLGGMTITLLRNDGSVYASRESDAQGRPLTTSFTLDDGTGVTVAATYSGVDGGASSARLRTHSRPPATTHRFLASCGTDDYTSLVYKWFSTLNWYWVSSSTPGYLNSANTLDSLRNAHTEWVNNVTWCPTIPDSSSFNTLYQGTISAVFGQNGYNTIGWGSVAGLHDPSCPSGSIACTTTWSSGSTATESDTRFDTDFPTWWNGAAVGKYDVYSVMAHELGHSAGFGHVGSPSNVMYPNANTNDTSNRQLGKGDADGNNAKY
jgi:hypothetical protein